jgi:hypothetical protein
MAHLGQLHEPGSACESSWEVKSEVNSLCGYVDFLFSSGSLSGSAVGNSNRVCASHLSEIILRACKAAGEDPRELRFHLARGSEFNPSLTFKI